MLTKTIRLIFISLLVCMLGSASLAQQSNQPAPDKEPQHVDFTGFKGKVLEVKNRDPRSLVSLLSPLGSGFKGAELRANTEFKTITVRDFPENIAAIEEALKRLDMPMPAKPAEPILPDVEIYGYVLIASQAAESGSNYPKAIDDVVKQLQANLSYKNYRLLTTVVQRTKLGGQVDSTGTASLPDQSFSCNYSFSIQRISAVSKEDDFSQLSLDFINLKLQGHPSPDGQVPGNVSMRTDLKIRDGEKVVVGTASLRDKALILVLTTKILK